MRIPSLPRLDLHRPTALELALGSLAVAVAVLIIPVATTLSRAALLAGLLAAWGLFVAAAVRARRRALVLALAAPVLAAGLFLALPGRSVDPAALRDTYLRALSRYQRATYVWGGERRWGIDCSGLVRMALSDALAEEALRTANPRAARLALDLWWHDASAFALGDGYGGRLRLVAIPASVNDASSALPGDLSVSFDGRHVIARVAPDTWIEADPRFQGVRRVKTPTGEGYYPYPARIMRWELLAGADADAL